MEEEALIGGLFWGGCQAHLQRWREADLQIFRAPPPADPPSPALNSHPRQANFLPIPTPPKVGGVEVCSSVSGSFIRPGCASSHGCGCRRALDAQRCALPPKWQRGADTGLIRTRDGRILPFGCRIITLVCGRRGLARRRGGTQPLTIILVCLLPRRSAPSPPPPPRHS